MPPTRLRRTDPAKGVFRPRSAEECAVPDHRERDDEHDDGDDDPHAGIRCDHGCRLPARRLCIIGQGTDLRCEG